MTLDPALADTVELPLHTSLQLEDVWINVVATQAIVNATCSIPNDDWDLEFEYWVCGE